MFLKAKAPRTFRSEIVARGCDKRMNPRCGALGPIDLKFDRGELFNWLS